MTDQERIKELEDAMERHGLYPAPGEYRQITDALATRAAPPDAEEEGT